MIRETYEQIRGCAESFYNGEMSILELIESLIEDGKEDMNTRAALQVWIRECKKDAEKTKAQKLAGVAALQRQDAELLADVLLTAPR